MMRARCLAAQTIVLSLTVFSGSALAQEGISFSQFFVLSTPGARANAMGRAFVGIADDASAAVTNPAGLILLTRPQIYAEFKSSFFDQREQFFDEEVVENRSLRGRLSFLAFSAPVSDRVAVAFSRHEFYGADYEVRFPDGTFKDEDRGTTFGGSVSAALRPDLKVGVTITGSRLKEFDPVVDPDSTVMGVIVGGLWEASEQVAIGAVFATSQNEFTQPTRFAVGVGLRPTPLFTLGFDLGWTKASDIFDRDFPDEIVLSTTSTTDLHVGGEYQLVTGANRVFLRGGLFTSQDRLSDISSTESGTTVTGTAGVGIAVGRRFQIDVAGLTRKEVVLSAAVRF